ncbi:MAG: bifunctional glutamate N-acetyltransferase/amino-acid acetyltransferase ArgJ [bacterium]
MEKLPQGFSVMATRCAIGKKKKEDLGMIYCEVPAVGAAVFTTNKVKAAPVLVSREKLRNSRVQAVVVNSGCANACTGKRGLKDARDTAIITSGLLGIKKDDVFVSSTGLIGSFLPMDKIKKGIKRLCGEIKVKKTSDVYGFARAIMTTDTVDKVLTRQFKILNKKITVTGFAKGAGMICPDMATMLSFIVSDVKISAPMLKKALRDAVDGSFNMLTVDGDTSTNDTVLVLANGRAGNKNIIKDGTDFLKFSKCLNEVSSSLAAMIARDGEGATKLTHITVKGASSFSEAKKGALTVANSSLVKTALFGRDPNWGRIVAAIGRAGIDMDQDRLDVYITSMGSGESTKVKLVKGGCGASFDIRKARNILNKKELEIIIDLKMGRYEASVFTCDLTSGYIKINAHYTT